jgi:uncharacterized membrane-anchored protein
MSVKAQFFAAVVVQVLILLGMVGRHEYTLQTGQAVLLETAPVDPWSATRGQYLQLNYTISQLRSGQVELVGAPYKSGQQVWVRLQKGDPYWTATAVYPSKPPAAAGQVDMRGTVQWMMPDAQDQPTTAFIRYGVEQFYVPEGEGPKLEQQRQALSVEVKVDRYGRGAISRVFVDGKEVRFN